MRTIGAEFLKVTTTRMWWVLAIVLVLYVAALAGGLGAFFGWYSTNPDGAPAGQPMPSTDALAPLVYGFATTVGYVFPVLLGALAVTGEFRHRLLTPTFLANPHRAGVLWAKFGVLFVFGALFGVFGYVATLGAGGGALAGFGVDPVFDDVDTWLLVARGILAMAIWAAIGVGLGTVVPNQVAAIVIVIAFTQFLEPILRFVAALNDITAQIAQYLPGAASDALVGASFYAVSGSGMPTPVSLEWWQGGLVLAGYAVLFTLIGYATSWRRDVT
ncbi:ABC transporter permease [Agromyces seonyuensis]|uniref:ABC transporter permease n=1 Tax=Agromyces seonyuensis TaxID=2662446 RepID=A0A6I4NZC2_9MICO|nr:ABC transporter permease [Agromyces seonyuensis]MWB98572.1 ABC transporter permease [Agromyces seonyuensis]